MYVMIMRQGPQKKKYGFDRSDAIGERLLVRDLQRDAVQRIVPDDDPFDLVGCKNVNKQTFEGTRGTKKKTSLSRSKRDLTARPSAEE
jgi:hypothetical protein